MPPLSPCIRAWVFITLNNFNPLQFRAQASRVIEKGSKKSCVIWAGREILHIGMSWSIMRRPRQSPGQDGEDTNHALGKSITHCYFHSWMHEHEPPSITYHSPHLITIVERSLRECRSPTRSHQLRRGGSTQGGQARMTGCTTNPIGTSIHSFFYAAAVMCPHVVCHLV